MAISTVGGLVKAGRGLVKVVKGIAEGDAEEVVKGSVKVVRGCVRVVTGTVTGNVVEGGEISDEAEEEY